jgi:hypothetical protein
MKQILALILCVAPLAMSHASVLIGGSVRNGDFNADTSDTDARSFADTPDWTNLAGNQATQATRSNVDVDGTRNAVLNLNDTRLFGNDTGYAMQAGDAFSVRYEWRDAANWNDDLDQVQVALFTTDDDSITGTRTDLVTDLSGLSTVDSTYETVDHEAIYTAVPSDAGKYLFVEFKGLPGEGSDTSGFSRLDNFVLEVTLIPEPSSMALLGLGALALLRRRR